MDMGLARSLEIFAMGVSALGESVVVGDDGNCPHAREGRLPCVRRWRRVGGDVGWRPSRIRWGGVALGGMTLGSRESWRGGLLACMVGATPPRPERPTNM